MMEHVDEMMTKAVGYAVNNATINLVIHLVKRPVDIGVNKNSRSEAKDTTYVDENLLPCLTTFSTASKKSLSVATFLLALIANIPASVATLLNSAPVVFGHNLAIKSNRMSRSTLMLLA